jgi:neutral ceramidase
VDPTLAVIAVDDLEGKPIATLWNFAVHGTCHSSKLMQYSGDISGVANEMIEEKGLGVAIYMVKNNFF